MSGLAVGLAVLSAWLIARKHAFTPRALNVIFVTADTLRADELGCYGNRDIATPHIDALAASGVLFENTATTAPLTLPAHASIFTGTYPIYHGVRDNGGYYLQPEQRTLAESLHDRGYATGAFVGAFVLDSRWGVNQGFDHYFDDFDPTGFDNATLSSIYRRGDEVLERAIAWMDSHRDGLFFSWIHFYDAHRPYDPPEPFLSRHSKTPWGAYDGEVEYVDSLVGELMTWLETTGLDDSTIVIFVGDHGESLGDHQELTHGFFVYDATMRVPFLVAAPRAFSAGRRVAAQVRTIDIMPTVLELVGAEVPVSVQGVSLVPLARGVKNDLELAAYGESLFPQHYGWSALASLRTARVHYIEAPTPELYDLERDPGEQTNLAAHRAATVRELRDRLEQIRARLGADENLQHARSKMDRQTQKKLAALGYLNSGTAARTDPSKPPADPKDKIHLFELIRASAVDSDSGRWDEALAKLERVLAEDPDIPEAYHLLGSVQAERGKSDEAIAAYREALDRDPDYKPALFGLALSLKEAGRIDEAAANLDRVLELDPGASQASFVLAKIQIDRGRFADANALLEEVGDRGSPGERALRHNLLAETHIGMNELDRAQQEIGRALQLKADLPEGHYNLGLVLEQRGRAAEAIDAYEKELEISSDNFRAHFNLAKLAGQAGRDRDMMTHLEASVAANPRFVDALFYLANAYLDRGELERAMELARNGIEIGTESDLLPFGHFILADVYRRLGRPGDAAREMALARRLRGS